MGEMEKGGGWYNQEVAYREKGIKPDLFKTYDNLKYIKKYFEQFEMFCQNAYLLTLIFNLLSYHISDFTPSLLRPKRFPKSHESLS